MKRTIISLMFTLPDTSVVPEWVHLMPAGTFSGVDGRGPYVADDLQAIIQNSMKPGRKLPFDINHSTDLLGTVGQEAPAVGWIVALEARDDGIWGKVEWNDKGRVALKRRYYGFISPALMVTASKPHKVQSIARASLTNDPNLTLTSLHSRKHETGEPDMEEELRKALGLPETADQTAIVTAVTAAVTEISTHAAALGRIAAAGGLTDVTADGIVVALQSRANAGDDTEKVELKDQVKSLQGQLTTLTNTSAKERAETVIAKALEDGKIVPALRDRFITRHMKDPADVEAELALMPSLHSSSLRNYRPNEDGSSPLSPDDRMVSELMGVDQTAFAETAKTLKKETF